jgi:hypothetical protein
MPVPIVRPSKGLVCRNSAAVACSSRQLLPIQSMRVLSDVMVLFLLAFDALLGRMTDGGHGHISAKDSEKLLRDSADTPVASGIFARNGHFRTLAGNLFCGEATQNRHRVAIYLSDSPMASLIKTKVEIILNGVSVTETEHSMAVSLNRNQNERLY